MSLCETRQVESTLDTHIPQTRRNGSRVRYARFGRLICFIYEYTCARGDSDIQALKKKKKIKNRPNE